MIAWRTRPSTFLYGYTIRSRSEQKPAKTNSTCETELNRTDGSDHWAFGSELVKNRNIFQISGRVSVDICPNQNWTKKPKTHSPINPNRLVIWFLSNFNSHPKFLISKTLDSLRFNPNSSPPLLSSLFPSPPWVPTSLWPPPTSPTDNNSNSRKPLTNFTEALRPQLMFPSSASASPNVAPPSTNLLQQTITPTLEGRSPKPPAPPEGKAPTPTPWSLIVF